MTFATRQDITTTIFTSTAQTHNANYPATVDSGDLLLLLVGVRGGTTITVSGYTALYDTYPGGQEGAAFFKRANGTEGGTTIDVHTTDFMTMVVKILRYKGHHTSSDPEVGTAATGTSTTPDPPTLTPSWGAEDTVWVACAAAADGNVASAAPASYSNLSSDHSADGSNESDCSVAFRDLNATSDNPGSFTLANSVLWVANTIAIRPAAAPTNRPMFRGS